MKKLFLLAAACLFTASCDDMSFRTLLDRMVTNAAPTVSIVYNDSVPADVTLANSLRTLLVSDPTITTGVSGTMPSWTVTLTAQGALPAGYDSKWILPGVIIVTPGTTVYTDPARSQNLAYQQKGVIAMGSGGLRFLDTVTANWSSWGLSGQKPSQIGFAKSSSGGGVDQVNAWGTGQSRDRRESVEEPAGLHCPSHRRWDAGDTLQRYAERAGDPQRLTCGPRGWFPDRRRPGKYLLLRHRPPGQVSPVRLEPRARPADNRQRAFRESRRHDDGVLKGPAAATAIRRTR